MKCSSVLPVSECCIVVLQIGRTESLTAIQQDMIVTPATSVSAGVTATTAVDRVALQALNIIPASALILEEKTWLVWPYCRTIISIPFLPKVSASWQ